MPTAPDILNYFIGKGVLVFVPEGGSPRDLGNAPAFSVTPEIEKLDHFSSRSGVRTKDRSVAVETSGTVNITLDEITTDNLALALFGLSPVAANTDGEEEFDILSEAEVKGELRFEGTNDIGSRFRVVVLSVSFTPTNPVEFINDEFGQIELEGEMLAMNSVFGSVTKILDAV